MKKILNVFLLIMLVFICGSCNKNNLPKEEIDLEKAWNEYFHNKSSDYRKLLGTGNGSVEYSKYSDTPDNVRQQFSFVVGKYKEVIYFKWTSGEYTYFHLIFMTFDNPYISTKNLRGYSYYKNSIYLGTIIENRYLNNYCEKDGMVLSRDHKILFDIERSKYLVIENDVSAIGSFAFCGDSVIENIVVEGNVKVICQGAFKNATALKSVVIKKGITEIHNYAFYNAKNLEYVILPDGEYHITSDVFNTGTIFCEKTGKGNTWSKNFISGDAKIYYKGEWAIGDDGHPYVIGD